MYSIELTLKDYIKVPYLRLTEQKWYIYQQLTTNVVIFR
jgi:hypothetical protein